METKPSAAAPLIDEIVARVLVNARARNASMPAPKRRMSWSDLDTRLRRGPGCAEDFRRRLHHGPGFRFSASRTYAMNDFLCLRGVRFVEACYAGILGRPADAAGFHNYLDALLSGTRKAEIVVRMRYSPEGRRYGARIRGLAVHAIAVALFRIPVAGYLAECGVALISLPRMLRGLRALEADDAYRRQQMAEEIERALRRIEGEATRGAG